MGLGTSPGHPLALGQSELMCPDLADFLPNLFIHSFIHLAVCSSLLLLQTLKKRKYNLIIQSQKCLFSFPPLCYSLFCHCCMLSSLFSLPSLILFFPFKSSQHIALFLTSNLSLVFLQWSPFFFQDYFIFFFSHKNILLLSCSGVKFCWKGLWKSCCFPSFLLLGDEAALIFTDLFYESEDWFSVRVMQGNRWTMEMVRSTLLRFINLKAMLRWTAFRRAAPNDWKSLNVWSLQQVQNLPFAGSKKRSFNG